MNKTAIRNYAVWARTALIEAVTQKAFEYELKEGQEMVMSLDSIDGRLLSANEKEWRRNLIDEIKRKSFTQVMEEVAYTWFNRFIALRYMEVNGFIPSRVRVFTNENGEFKPDILKEAMTVEIEGIDRAKVIDLLEKQNNEELFKYLIITQCNALNQGLPYMFEKISNWTELLFPSNLLRTDSIIGRMVNEIPEEDWQDAVQIIGWMYQYYNTELKDDTFANLKKNIKIPKDRIPAATQLFTPDWIVRYMVENSLGRLWIEGHPNNDLKANWKYYLEEAEQEPDVEVQLQKIREEYANVKPEDIKIIDPCMGSGHILVYAFDVLMQIYVANGYSEREAAKLILENNLFGLDIDDRAGQLAYFAVMMKARKYSRRILNGETKPNVLAIQDASFMNDDFINYVAGKDQTVKTDLMLLYSTFKDAKEYGSILNVPEMNFTALYERIDIISRSFAEDMFQMEYQKLSDEKLLPLVKQAEIMHQKYDVIVTNPPYMGASGMSNRLGEFIKKNYPDSKADLFAVFMEKGITMLKSNGYNSMVTMQSWMFLSSFESMRKKIISTNVITNLMHMENMVMGIAFGTAVSIFRNFFCASYKGTYNHITLADIEDGKPKEFPVKNNRFAHTSTDRFSQLPGSPIAYWLSDSFLNIFSKGKLLSEIADSKQGIATADNNKYLRLWSECDSSNIFFDCKSHDESEMDNRKWYPYNKGGEFRKWYGNNEYVVNWFRDGMELRADKKAVLRNPNYYFRPSFSWSLISSSVAAFRYKPYGQLFDVAGMSCFADKHFYYLLALCNTNIVMEVLKVIAPTINYQCGDIANIPVIIDSEKESLVEEITKQNVSISNADWDSFETSWDFNKHPLV